MKEIGLLFGLSVVLAVSAIAADPAGLVKSITWIENACVRIEGSQTIFFDPYQITERDTADIIFITHSHGDHFSKSSIDKIKTDKTLIVGPSSVTGSIDGEKVTVKPGDTIEVNGLAVRTIPSYNFHIPNHAREKGNVGFIVSMDGVTYYHPGDSDFIPEMNDVKADVVFLPVCGHWMMNAEEAVKAADLIGPKVVIPFHFGSVAGTLADAERFQKLYSGETVILESSP